VSEELQENPEFPVELPYRRVLDKGFVALVDVMGDDASIVQAARVSYGKGTKTVRSDKALISYLMRHRHTTPYEMIEFKFLMRLPVFIARQVIRHRTASVNEYSARYSVVPDRFWVPDLGAIAEQDTVNRQGRADLLHDLAEETPERAEPCTFSPGARAVLVREGRGISRAALMDPAHRSAFLGGDVLPTEGYVRCAELLLEGLPGRKARLERVRDTYREHNERCYGLYQKLIAEGVAREIARSVLPLSMYTEWYWKVDLHNLFHFLKLRMDPHAQLEVRAYGEAMAAFVKERIPLAWEAFENDNLMGTFLSRAEKDVLRPEGRDAQVAALRSLFERGYRRRRLKEVCRKLDLDERLVDEVDPPGAGA